MHFFWVNPLSTLTYPLVISSMSIPHWSSMISRVIHLYLIDLICSLSVFSHIMFLYFPSWDQSRAAVPQLQDTQETHDPSAERIDAVKVWVIWGSFESGEVDNFKFHASSFFSKKKASKNRLWSSLMSDLFVDLGAILWKRGWAAIKCTPAACRAYPS